MDQEKTRITKMQESYIKTLSEREHKAYLIAKDHLGSSFDLEKSIGYKVWKTDQEKTSA